MQHKYITINQSIIFKFIEISIYFFKGDRAKITSELQQSCTIVRNTNNLFPNEKRFLIL